MYCTAISLEAATETNEMIYILLQFRCIATGGSRCRLLRSADLSSRAPIVYGNPCFKINTSVPEQHKWRVHNEVVYYFSFGSCDWFTEEPLERSKIGISWTTTCLITHPVLIAPPGLLEPAMMTSFLPLNVKLRRCMRTNWEQSGVIAHTETLEDKGAWTWAVTE